MAYLHIKIKDIVEDRDADNNPRIRVYAEEASPRSITINISKVDGARMSEFHKLKGKIAMVPLREGMMNGSPFFSLLPDPIVEIPTGPIPVSKIVELDPVDDKKTDVGYFGKTGTGK